MNAPDAVAPPHHAGLDAVRGLAATAVVLVHVYQLFLLGGHVQGWARAGDAGVSVFFVLSGYLITASVVRDHAFSRRTYAIRRAARILPAYYVSLVIALVLVDATPLFTAGGRADVAVHLVLLHGLFPGMRYSINGVWWTLTVEVLFYALVALLAGVLRSARGGWLVVGGLVVTALAWRHLAWSPDRTETLYRIQQLPGVADLFAAGMALALAERTRWFADLLARGWARAALALGTATALPLVLWIYHVHHYTYLRNTRLVLLWPLALGLATAGLIACIRTWGPQSDRLARRSGLAFLGMVSFGVYLLHPFVIGAFGPAWFARNPDPPVAVFVLWALAGSLLTATGLHHLVERPGMAWGRRLVAGSGSRRSSAPTSPTARPTATEEPS